MTRSAVPQERPVLIVGVARSGTSWLGRALGHAGGALYVFEPDNVDANPRSQERAGKRGFGPYPVINPGQHHAGFEALWDMVFAGALPPRRGLRLAAARMVLRIPPTLRQPLVHGVARLLTRSRHGPRAIAKTIYSVFAIDWLCDRYQPAVVVLQRHPLNVISSWRELGIPLFDLTTRPAILDGHVRPLGIEPVRADAGELVRIAWCVGLLSTVLGDAADRHPDWVVTTHEDLCADPGPAMRELANRLELEWSPDIDRFLAQSDRPGTGLAPTRVTKEQPERWRMRLTTIEVEEVERTLRQFPRRGWVREPGQGMVRGAVASGGGR